MATIMGKEVALNVTTSGHYCIPIDKTEMVQTREVHALQLGAMDKKELKSIILKLHRQFAHPPKECLTALLKDAKVWRAEHDEILSDVTAKCQLCQRYAKAPKRPAVSSERIYKSGDLFLYKREGKDRWLGPGKVVFQDGNVIFLRHGGVFVRVSPNRLCPVDQGSDNEKNPKLSERKINT